MDREKTLTSLGTLPPKQTREGFYAGISVPVNDKLTEIFVQLHISEKSGRGVPRIVGTYGEQAFKFTDNAITVTIPYNRLDSGGGTPSVTPSDIPVDTPLDYYDNVSETGRKILEYCAEPHSSREIMDHLGLRDIKNIRDQINRLLSQGRIARTIPDKPNSKNQKYITIR